MARPWTFATALLGPLGCCLRDAASSPVAATRTRSLLAVHRVLAAAAFEDRLFGSPGVELGRTLLARVRAGSEGRAVKS